MESLPLIRYYNKKMVEAHRKAALIEREHFYFDYACSRWQRSQVFALRYKLFCLEYGHIPSGLYPNKQEHDIFDRIASTKHFVAFCDGRSGKICGTIRAIRDPRNTRFASSHMRGHPASQRGSLPIERHYSLRKFRRRGRNIEQVASLAVERGRGERIYFGLCKCVYLDAIDHGIDDIFIQANPRLAWLFEAIGFKKIYESWHGISSSNSKGAHKEIPVVGMHLDMSKIHKDFLSYFTLSSGHFLFRNKERIKGS
ncbi:hypothetical protein ACFL96_06170 [Thermoproteota archaeon]